MTSEACHVQRSSATSHEMSPKHLRRRLTSLASNWRGILTSIIKPLPLNKIDEKLYLSSSYETVKSAPNKGHK